MQSRRNRGDFILLKWQGLSNSQPDAVLPQLNSDIANLRDVKVW